MSFSSFLRHRLSLQGRDFFRYIWIWNPLRHQKNERERKNITGYFPSWYSFSGSSLTFSRKGKNVEFFLELPKLNFVSFRRKMPLQNVWPLGHSTQRSSYRKVHTVQPLAMHKTTNKNKGSIPWTMRLAYVAKKWEKLIKKIPVYESTKDNEMPLKAREEMNVNVIMHYRLSRFSLRGVEQV